jgi:hypothetical protein
MIALKRTDYPSQKTFDLAVDALSRDMPSAPMANGMAFFRDEYERKKCRDLDSIVRDDGFYIDYGDENDIENTEEECQ